MEFIRDKFIKEMDRIADQYFKKNKTTSKSIKMPVSSAESLTFNYRQKLQNAVTEEWSEKVLEFIENFKQILRDEEVDYMYSIMSFGILSHFLKASNLKEEEITQILMAFVEYNEKHGNLHKDALFLEIEALENTEFKTITKEDLEKLIKSRTFVDFLYAEDDELEPLERLKRDELLDHIDDFTCDIEDEISALRCIYECYIEKKENFTQEDKEMIMEAFKMLDVNPTILNKVSLVLEKRVEKDKKRAKRQEIPQKRMQVVKQEIKREDYLKSDKTYLTNKEYKMIKKRVSAIYDLRTGVLLKEQITYEEMMDCLADLYILGEEEAQMIRFLDHCKKIIPLKEDVVEKYRLLRDRLLKTLGISFVAPLDEYVEMIELDLDKEASGKALKQELEELLKFIPGHFVYEIEVTKQKIKEGKTL